MGWIVFALGVAALLLARSQWPEDRDRWTRVAFIAGVIGLSALTVGYATG